MKNCLAEVVRGHLLRAAWMWILVLGFVSQSALAEDAHPLGAADIGIYPKVDAQFPLDVTLRDASGRNVNLREYFGSKPVLFSLVYYECPSLCTTTLNGMLGAFKDLAFNIGDEFEVLTISFDHEETPELAAGKKSVYVDSYARPGAAEGWHFLVGDKAAVDRVTEAVGFRYMLDPVSGEFAHQAALIVLTPEGKVFRYLLGTDYPARDVRLSLVEASGGTIGSTSDKLALIFARFDPVVGKYAPNGSIIMSWVCFGAVIVLGISLITVFNSHRRERREFAPAGV